MLIGTEIQRENLSFDQQPFIIYLILAILILILVLIGIDPDYRYNLRDVDRGENHRQRHRQRYFTVDHGRNSCQAATGFPSGIYIDHHQ